MPTPILDHLRQCKADILRLEFLWHHGGVYVDAEPRYGTGTLKMRCATEEPQRLFATPPSTNAARGSRRLVHTEPGHGFREQVLQKCRAYLPGHDLCWEEVLESNYRAWQGGYICPGVSLERHSSACSTVGYKALFRSPKGKLVLLLQWKKTTHSAINPKL